MMYTADEDGLSPYLWLRITPPSYHIKSEAVIQMMVLDVQKQR